MTDLWPRCTNCRGRLNNPPDRLCETCRLATVDTPGDSPVGNAEHPVDNESVFEHAGRMVETQHNTAPAVATNELPRPNHHLSDMTERRG